MGIHETLRLAQIALDSNRPAEAAQHLRAAVQLAPNAAGLWNELGTTLARLGQMEAAVDAFRRAVVVQPSLIDAQENLGLALFHLERFDEAEAVYRQLVTANANHATAQFGLGTIQERHAQFEDARRSYESAIGAQPAYADAYINLGNVLWELGKTSEAHAAINRAVQLNPTSLAATRNLAVLFMRAGLVDRAIEQFRKALAMNPPESEAATLHSNLVATMFHQWPYAPPAHFEEHVRWAQRFADPLTAAAAPHESDGSPDRRLRIGYVSPDFRMHPVASFFEPILKHHDRQNFEVYCYANVAKTDEVTERFRASTDVWRDVAAMSDEQAAKQMREDRIDILVDLAGHTAGHRLLVFARKPAPVQVSYLGYMATTGMSAIDYRITDAYLDLPGKTERFHTEQLVRLLPKCYCYEPPSGPAELAIEPPKRANGFITFASSNRLVKVNSDVMTAWARITQGVEHSRLVLLAPGSRDAAERCLAHLEQHGVARQRVELLPSLPYRKYLQTLAQFDIGLDAFPVSGHTTTCNTLWMGTPVVTLAGETYVSRLGASVLANLGLHNLIASNVDEYVRIAIDLAHDEARLAQLRRDLRGLVEDRVADGLTFTRQLEGAYRMMWRRWCA